jgi:hypothetical protein
MSIAIRPFVKKDLTRFVSAISPLMSPSAVNFALITDTHDKAKLPPLIMDLLVTGMYANSNG